MRGNGALVSLGGTGWEVEQGAMRSLILLEPEMGRESCRVITEKSHFRSVTIWKISFLKAGRGCVRGEVALATIRERGGLARGLVDIGGILLNS